MWLTYKFIKIKSYSLINVLTNLFSISLSFMWIKIVRERERRNKRRNWKRQKDYSRIKWNYDIYSRSLLYRPIKSKLTCNVATCNIVMCKSSRKKISKQIEKDDAFIWIYNIDFSFIFTQIQQTYLYSNSSLF